MAAGSRVAQAVQTLAGNRSVEEAVDAVAERFSIDAEDFLSARERGASAGTRLEQAVTSLGDAGQVVNRSGSEQGSGGARINVITPVVIPKHRSLLALWPVVLLAIAGAAAGAFLRFVSAESFATAMFGPHFWVLVVAIAVFLWIRRSVVNVPDGCQALITRFGRLVHTADAGRTVLLDPWKRVAYIVNTHREYPYNAPIREAPTESGVKASVDLFLQFRIEDPASFIFTLGAVQGFADKLQNSISEVTRSLIYSQRAESIYDLVGESTQGMLASLNQQFLPAVRLTNANITHAEPSNQDYRMDLAAPEMVRVAKEAYTYQYELSLRKQQNEGELDKELASLRETLSAIEAEIATSQAQIDTALERETNRATATAHQRMVEAESTANANAALLEAQALDIRAVSAASAPEILQYRFERELLDRLAGVADALPQVIDLGDGQGPSGLNFLALARQVVGVESTVLFSEQELTVIRSQLGAIHERIEGRQAELDELASDRTAAEQDRNAGDLPGQDVVESLRASVTDEAVQQRVEDLTDGEIQPGSGPPPPSSPPPAPPEPPTPPAGGGP